MAASELSIEQIHKYLLEKGGIVANREVVRHFKRYLTDPLSQDDARAKFKRFVNILATTKSEGSEKFLILRQKYSVAPDDNVQASLQNDDTKSTISQSAPNLSPSSSISGNEYTPNASPIPRLPPPYRPPPPVTSPSPSFDNLSLSSSNLSMQEQSTPQAPPRRRSGEKNSELNSSPVKEKKSDEEINEDEPSEGDKLSISVKERTQKFNKMASLEDVLGSKQHKKKQPDKGVDEDDGASVILLDTKRCAEWYVTAAKGDYHQLAKLASDEPKFVKLKDPYTNVLHWGAKHDNPDIIKLFAGTYKCDVNAKTNGGYTPLHLAAQFGHERVYKLLVEVYHAKENMRDFSGRTPSQYKSSQTQTTAMDANKKGRKKLAEKDLGFLRIGSLNVRVKKTTEAFSNFLGVGNAGAINPVDGRNVHKGWGSADNVTQDYMLKGQKRKSKRPLENVGTNSTPGTPNHYPRAISQRNFVQDSDSDSAAGFDSNWKN